MMAFKQGDGMHCGFVVCCLFILLSESCYLQLSKSKHICIVRIGCIIRKVQYSNINGNYLTMNGLIVLTYHLSLAKKRTVPITRFGQGMARLITARPLIIHDSAHNIINIKKGQGCVRCSFSEKKRRHQNPKCGMLGVARAVLFIGSTDTHTYVT